MGTATTLPPCRRHGRHGPASAAAAPVEIRGEGLTIDDVVAVARRGAPVRITDDPEVRRRIEASLQYVVHAAQVADRIYGVTTGFGGMANVVIPPSDAGALQENIARFMSVGAGRPLRTDDVRAAMLLRANSHLRGASGLRFELIRRLTVFLNEGVTPLIREFGSIGASGDLAPLAQVDGRDVRAVAATSRSTTAARPSTPRPRSAASVSSRCSPGPRRAWR